MKEGRHRLRQGGNTNWLWQKQVDIHGAARKVLDEWISVVNSK